MSGQPEVVGARSGGWFVRITILVVVVLWLIPALGVLITSFRPEALADTTGWWSALPHLLDSSQWTLENYRTALDSGGFSNAFMNSLAVAVPSTIIPITVAAFAAPLRSADDEGHAQPHLRAPHQVVSCRLMRHGDGVNDRAAG